MKDKLVNISLIQPINQPIGLNKENEDLYDLDLEMNTVIPPNVDFCSASAGAACSATCASCRNTCGNCQSVGRVCR
jgi:hypothetical protein